MTRLHDHRPIVCVEDSDEDFLAISHALRAAGAGNPIQRCADGRAAQDALASAPSCAWTNAAALILLDLNLPGVNGHDLLTALRHREGDRRTPVIVLSSSALHVDIERCYQEGANAYLVKPMALEALEDMMAGVVKFWLRLATPPAPQQRRAA